MKKKKKRTEKKKKKRNRVTDVESKLTILPGVGGKEGHFGRFSLTYTHY